jgi:hemolysin III
MLSCLAQTTRPPDGGPIYVETDLQRLIAEPFNALSALLFIVIVIYWLIRLRGRYRRYAFLTACLPLVLIGGVGGTVYHAFRAHRVWLVMDWLPIVLLSFAICVYLWLRVLRRFRWLVLLILPGVFLLQRSLFLAVRAEHLPIHWAINLSYSLLAVIILTPTAIVLWRTRCAHAHWPLLAVMCFVGAILARAFDRQLASLLPMGSHFLWHLLGAGAAQCLALYLYHLGPLPGRAERTQEPTEITQPSPAISNVGED